MVRPGWSATRVSPWARRRPAYVQTDHSRSASRRSAGLAVEEYAGERVEPLEHQVRAGGRRRERRGAKRPAKGPLLPPDPLDALLVGAGERVLQLAGRQERFLDAAGNVRGDRRMGVTRAAQLPFSVQRDAKHLHRSGLLLGRAGIIA